MGGVDVCDQQLEAYRTWIKTKKWTLKVALHFIDLSIFFIIYYIRGDWPLDDIDTIQYYTRLNIMYTDRLDMKEKEKKKNEIKNNNNKTRKDSILV